MKRARGDDDSDQRASLRARYADLELPDDVPLMDWLNISAIFDAIERQVSYPPAPPASMGYRRESTQTTIGRSVVVLRHAKTSEILSYNITAKAAVHAHFNHGELAGMLSAIEPQRIFPLHKGGHVYSETGDATAAREAVWLTLWSTNVSDVDLPHRKVVDTIRIIRLTDVDHKKAARLFGSDAT